MADKKQESKQSRENNGNTKKKNGRAKAFFKGVLAELKKVHWPSKKQLASYTGVVIFTVAVMAIAISIFDWGISAVFEWLLGLGA